MFVQVRGREYAFKGSGDQGNGGRPAERLSLLHSCLQRIRRWRVPPNWSVRDWFEQMRAHVVSAAWEAEHDYDPARGVPLRVFTHLRVMASARTQYRREWTYGLRYVSDDPAQERGSERQEGPTSAGIRELLHTNIALLPEGDRWLLEQLFWQGATQAEVARKLRISQPAVCKRKRAILKKLLLSLDGETKRAAVIERRRRGII